MAEKGIDDVEVVHVELAEDARHRPEFLGRVGVPLLPRLKLDDGTVMGRVHRHLPLPG